MGAAAVFHLLFVRYFIHSTKGKSASLSLPVNLFIFTFLFVHSFRSSLLRSSIACERCGGGAAKRKGKRKHYVSYERRRCLRRCRSIHYYVDGPSINASASTNPPLPLEIARTTKYYANLNDFLYLFSSLISFILAKHSKRFSFFPSPSPLLLHFFLVFLLYFLHHHEFRVYAVGVRICMQGTGREYFGRIHIEQRCSGAVCIDCGRIVRDVSHHRRRRCRRRCHHLLA